MDTMALTRPAAPRKLRITLTAGQAAAAAARNEVRAAIRAWNIPVHPSVAVLLTSELVTNALRHEAGKAIDSSLAVPTVSYRWMFTTHRPPWRYRWAFQPVQRQDEG